MLEVGKVRSLSDVARRLLWWKKEEQWFQDEARLIAQIMVFGDLEDTQAMLRMYPAERLKAVLDDPPCGVFTTQAWNFWHLYLGKELRSLPKRSFRTSEKQDH